MPKKSMETGERFIDFVRSLDDDDLAELKAAVEREKMRRRYGADDFDGLARAFGAQPICPECGEVASSPYAKRQENGQERFRCGCGASFTIMSGTAFASAKIRPWKLEEIIGLMAFNASVDEIADVAGVHHNTALLARRKVFESISAWQSKVRLSGRVFIDEIYTFDSAMPKNHFGKNPKGLNRTKICVFLAVDAAKNMVAFVIGHGKPKKSEVKKALLPHLSPQAELIVHDGEKAHIEAVRASGASEEVHPSKAATEGDLVAMLLINSFCSWVQRFLAGYTGMDSEYLQDYLNWFVYLFQCKKSSKKWSTKERVFRHVILARADIKRRGVPEKKKACRKRLNWLGRAYKSKQNLSVTNKFGRFQKK